ncbi:MAG: insulinase family protein [Ignavibacteriales bacterium]|nr:insulinase family protein [Ignavibacteriales bacterium]
MQLVDDPSYVASNEFNKIIFLNSPYQSSSTGVNDAIEKLTNSDIKDFFINRYLPNGSFIILVGNLKQKDSIKILNNYFKDWQLKESKNFTVNITKTKKKIILIDKPTAAQSELRIGHFSTGRNSKDFYAKTILNSILGGQFSSRINLNLREDKGFTYGAHSNFNYNAAGGSFVVSTSIKTENTAEAIKEILFELDNIKDSVTQEELDFAKSYLIRRYPSLFETYTQMASNISLLPIFNLPVNYFENYITEINKVTIDEVANAGKHNINFEELITVIVGNKKLVKEQLTKFDSFNIGLEEI